MLIIIFLYLLVLLFSYNVYTTDDSVVFQETAYPKQSLAEDYIEFWLAEKLVYLIDDKLSCLYRELHTGYPLFSFFS